ncbi:hypothetical protein Angca_009012 [Angiostrongylus cantonensis]|nr:hypothetical protein Angca_009012 [Angiostrongylus cantonensis]
MKSQQRSNEIKPEPRSPRSVLLRQYCATRQKRDPVQFEIDSFVSFAQSCWSGLYSRTVHQFVMSDDPKVKEFTLKEDHELRFEVGNTEVVLELLQGRAEVFGTELEMHKKYAFPQNTRVAVFSWKGASVELIGPTTSAYVAEHTPMVIYLNTHAALEQLRQHTEEQASVDGTEIPKGPRIMLVGPTDVGKTTVCRILCNYAVRQGRSPVYVDLDVGQGSISVPGTIGALFINKTADVVEGFDRSKPLVYNFGHTSPGENLTLYDLLVKELADSVTLRCATHPEANLGGLVINTCGWVTGEGYACIVSAAEAFEVDVVIVLDHERLFNELQRDLPTFVKILHQPKSGGVETRSRQSRLAARSASIHRYFYGVHSNPYFPFTFELNFAEMIFCKIGTEKLPESCLPFGSKIEDHQTKVCHHNGDTASLKILLFSIKVLPINPSSDMAHRMFAVTPCPTVSQAVLKESVLGFVVITEINMEEKRMTVLCPQNSLAHKVLVWTDVTFLDDQVTRTAE